MKVWVLHGIGDIQFEVKNKNNPDISMKNGKEIQKFL